MYEVIFVAPWPWWVAGPAIGLVVALLAWLLGKSLGVSTGGSPGVGLKWPLRFAGR
jgi:phosphotransferase system  glucose/maltose/N-acetylglucosamine-specific IIC component